MSLAQRLSTVQASRANAGCATCNWLKTIPAEDQQAINNWIADKLSIAQLHEICANDDQNPLPVSDSAFRNHIRRHHQRTVS